LESKRHFIIFVLAMLQLMFSVLIQMAGVFLMIQHVHIERLPTFFAIQQP